MLQIARDIKDKDDDVFYFGLILLILELYKLRAERDIFEQDMELLDSQT